MKNTAKKEIRQERRRERRHNRKLWFRRVKSVLRLFVKRPDFVYLGEEPSGQNFFLSNHVGASGPLTLELYGHEPFRFWGTYEMNSNLGEVYKYLSNIYFYRKKHMNHTLARIISVVAAPVLWVFYRGLNLISTYPDLRFKKTIRESLEVLRDEQSLVIFPEQSANGYFDELTHFHSGFVVMAERCLKEGMDLPVFLGYYRKRDKKFIVDKPIMISDLLRSAPTKEAIAEKMRLRCNELGKMKIA